MVSHPQWSASGHSISEVAPLANSSGPESEADNDRRGSVVVKSRSVAAIGLILVGVVALANLGTNDRKSEIARWDDTSNSVNLNTVELTRTSSKSSTQKKEADSDTSPKEGNKTLERMQKEGESRDPKCSWGKENCNKTQCCNNPGLQCYEQTKWYAQCKPSCEKGVDPTHWDGIEWSCKELGKRAKGDTIECSAQGEDCRETRCCQTPNTQCFAKNDDWATCKSDCLEGAPDLTDSNGDPWSCKTLGDWTPGPADWVAEQCSPEGDDCSNTKCCTTPGMKCFAQSDFWAQCKYDCQTKDPDAPWGPDWSCEARGPRTPSAGGAPPGKVGEWALDECANEGEDCHVSKCCLGNNMQCYAKNEDWAMCMDTCTEGVHPGDDNETWSCKPLGPRLTSGLAIKGAPSLFCWSLFQTTTYEMDIMKLQLKEDAGIFQCDDFALLSTDAETVLGKTQGGTEAKTMQVEKAEITTSVDGTAGNAKLFINCWKVLIDDGRWKRHAWIIKVDPDAVIVPYRVRDHLRSHVMENVYVVNCNAFPSSPNFPMMYGSVEIYSFMAIATYEEKNGKCLEDMGMMLPKWGEDYYMTHCLDHIGVGRISDFTSVGDNVCSGGSCADSAFSAFHPFKSQDEWHNCWDLAMGYITPPPEPTWM